MLSKRCALSSNWYPMWGKYKRSPIRFREAGRAGGERTDLKALSCSADCQQDSLSCPPALIKPLAHGSRGGKWRNSSILRLAVASAVASARQCFADEPAARCRKQRGCKSADLFTGPCWAHRRRIVLQVVLLQSLTPCSSRYSRRNGVRRLAVSVSTCGEMPGNLRRQNYRQPMNLIAKLG